MRKALVVGINHYDNKDYQDLNGCHYDAERMYDVLSYHEKVNDDKERNFQVNLLKAHSDKNDKKITRRLLQQKISELFNDDHSEVALFFFSGHGYENSLGGYLVTQDAYAFEEGVSVNDVLIYANNSKVKDIIIILDCCYAGQMGSFPILESGTAILRKGITILTSSGPNQFSYEVGRQGGRFTTILINALEGGSTDILGNVKASHLYEHADDLLGPWDQRPSLKANVAKEVIIRKTQPKVPQHILANIPNLFTKPGTRCRLDKRHLLRKDEEGHDPEKALEMEHLEILFKRGLIEPQEAKTLTEAAQKETGCMLSGVGKFYWQMVFNGRI